MSSEPKPYQIRSDGIVLHVRLTPKGGRDAVDGITTLSDGHQVLKMRVRAVPEDGAANAALVATLAAFLQIPKSKIRLETGQTARLKTVLVDMDLAVFQDTLDRLNKEGSPS